MILPFARLIDQRFDLTTTFDLIRFRARFDQSQERDSRDLLPLFHEVVEDLKGSCVITTMIENSYQFRCRVGREGVRWTDCFCRVGDNERSKPWTNVKGDHGENHDDELDG